MPRYLLTGGRQRPTRLKRLEEWNAFERALVLELDSDTGRLRTLMEYTSPAAHCPAVDPSILFKSASWDGDRLLLCTQTEVLITTPRPDGTLAIERVISHPWFNDVHHVARIGGRLHVVSTGLDAVLVLDGDEVVEVHGVTGESPWTRFDRATDYRRVETTKPHRAHPNYVFEAEGARWVTRFEPRDAAGLDGEAPTERIADRPIHDGVLVDGLLWFTVVSGQVVTVDPATRRVVRRYDLDRVPRANPAPLGWCRGIHVEPGRALVGFSRLRPTSLKQNLAWLRTPLHLPPEPAPCRVVAYDLAAGREIAAWHLEDAGLSAVFSILPAPGS